MAFAQIKGLELFYEERGTGVPILLIPPAGGTTTTWGDAADALASVGRVITYDRRGYARTGGAPAHSFPPHAADAAALLDALGAAPAVVAGQSFGATVALDLARRRPDLVCAVVAHESGWRGRRHPDASALTALATMWWLERRGSQADAAESFLRWVYAYRDGGSAWDAFPEAWRGIVRDNAQATLADIWTGTGDYPSPRELARIATPVVCAYGTRSRDLMPRIARALAHTIPTATVREIDGAGHAAAFDVPAGFVQVIADTLRAALLPQLPAREQILVGGDRTG